MPPENTGTTTPATAAAVTPTDPTSLTPATAADPAAATSAAAEPAKTPEAPKEDTRVAKRFAALSKREREIQLDREKIKREREEIATEREKNKSLEEELKKDPLGALKKYGKTYSDITKQLLNDGKKTPEDEIAELRAQVDAERQAREAEKTESAKRELEERQTAFRGQIGSALKANEEKFELTLAEGDDGIATVYNVMQEYWAKHQTVLSIEDAATMVEKQIEDLIDAKYIKLKKIQARFNKKEEPKKEPSATTGAEPVEPPKTLSNSLNSGGPSRGAKPLSNEESLAEAAKLIKWTQD